MRLSLLLMAAGIFLILGCACDVDMPWDHRKIGGDYTLRKVEGNYYLEYRRGEVLPGGPVVRFGRDENYLIVERTSPPHRQVFAWRSDHLSELTSQQVAALPELRTILLISP